MIDQLSVDELKQRGKDSGYTMICRQKHGAHPVALATWNGFSPEAGSAYTLADVSYSLGGNIVTVHKTGEAEVFYVLS
jgi:hypothetical protein